MTAYSEVRFRKGDAQDGFQDRLERALAPELEAAGMNPDSVKIREVEIPSQSHHKVKIDVKSTYED